MLFQTFLMILSFASLLSSNCPKFLTPSKKLLTLLFFSLRFLYAIVVSGGERPRRAVVRRSRCSVLCLCVLCDSNFQKKCEKQTFWLATGARRQSLCRQSFSHRSRSSPELLGSFSRWSRLSLELLGILTVNERK